jgi:hypothetical protein
VAKFGLNDEPILILSVSGTMPFEELSSRAGKERMLANKAHQAAKKDFRRPLGTE